MMIFAAQLVLNLVWSWLFFEWNLLLLALVEIVVLLGAILAILPDPPDWPFRVNMGAKPPQNHPQNPPQK